MTNKRRYGPERVSAITVLKSTQIKPYISQELRPSSFAACLLMWLVSECCSGDVAAGHPAKGALQRALIHLADWPGPASDCSSYRLCACRATNVTSVIIFSTPLSAAAVAVAVAAAVAVTGGGAGRPAATAAIFNIIAAGQPPAVMA